MAGQTNNNNNNNNSSSSNNIRVLDYCWYINTSVSNLNHLFNHNIFPPCMEFVSHTPCSWYSAPFSPFSLDSVVYSHLLFPATLTIFIDFLGRNSSASFFLKYVVHFPGINRVPLLTSFRFLLHQCRNKLRISLLSQSNLDPTCLSLSFVSLNRFGFSAFSPLLPFFSSFDIKVINFPSIFRIQLLYLFYCS